MVFFLQVIVRQSVDKAEFQDSSVEKILKLLFNHCESEEEGVRNVVAECLGKIALIEPAKLVPALKVSTKQELDILLLLKLRFEGHLVTICWHNFIVSCFYRCGQPVQLHSLEQQSSLP